VTLDLAQFHGTFFEESFEALDSMEAALLKLSAGDVDAELINTIFRVAHSIKGGSATFGFADVAAFTHTLETLLDQLRAGKRQVSPGLVDVLLRSCDLMREMLGATRARRPRASLRDRDGAFISPPVPNYCAAATIPCACCGSS
jgi:two-component system, chemotaxis family, sensor kinase CheA